MKMQNKKQKGITLIALIITIVILLILATVTVDVAIDGKLFDTAKEAVDKTNDRVGEEQETIDELMNEWDKIQGNTEETPNTNTGGENNNTGDGGEIIDNTPPTVTVAVEGTTTNSITVNVTARDNETGMISEPQYTYYIKEASTNTYEQKATNKNSSYTYTKLTQGTTYDIKVEVNGDEAGNVGTGTTQGTTGTVTSALEEGAITFSNVIWSSGKASVTINTNTSYNIEYQLNGISGSWTGIQNGGTISNLEHGTTIYARLTDGNNAGDYTSMDIQDKTAPTATITINEITSESIKVTVAAQDNETGLATSETYAYYLNTESTARSTGTSNTYTYLGLTGKTQYTITVVIKDQARNEKKVTQTVTTDRNNTAPVIADANHFMSSRTTSSLNIVATATDADGDALTYTIWTSETENGTYSAVKTSEAIEQNTQVTLSLTSLPEYTTYYWYIVVSDGRTNTKSSTKSTRTLCSGTGLICNTQNCSGSTKIDCDTCYGQGKISADCSGGYLYTCNYCENIPLEDRCKRYYEF